ncbi:MAG: hypothetical protein MI867_03710 [Pseudomonadales bacterium]|nr:hypothetical protein [Pseudomonadales bacterium]
MSNQSSFYLQIIRVVIKELILHRVMVTLLFSGTMLAIVIIGLFYPLKFTSSATIIADQQNIIAPLLEGQAEVTQVRDQSQLVKEVVYSARILSVVIKQLDLVEPDTSPKEQELIQNDLRKNLLVKAVGPGIIKLTATNSDPGLAFNHVSKVTELFIKDASESKRSESREAFQFIDKQVKSYKSQLQNAEENLKAFKASNTDGSERDVKDRIGQLRRDIERMELDLEDANTTVDSVQGQLAQESRYVARQFRSDVYRERLAEAQSRLATLQLSYKDTYPDIVTLKHQIADLKDAIQEAETDDFEPDAGASEGNVNPLYERLRSDLAAARTNVSTLERRLRLTKALLDEEYERLKRIAEQEAQLAELTRDYTVTREIYEDMLDRKEKARLSMTLDIEGQGVTYKIQEPAVFPLNPTGLRFLHFVLIGPILGVLFPVGLVVAYVMLDPRIRFVDKLEQEIDIPVLGVVPHIHTKLSQRVLKGDVLLLATLLIVVFAAYVSIVVLRVKGFV